MKPNWLISNNCFDDGNPEKMRDAAIAAGCAVNWFQYIPFEADNRQKLQFAHNSCSLQYGLIQLARLVQRHTAWVPGADWIDWRQLECSYYLGHWGKYSIHQKYAYCSLSEFLRNKEQYYKMFSTDNRLFLKPNGNTKSFHGEVVAWENIGEWEKYIHCYKPEMSDMMLFGETAEIDREWRLVIAEKKVITGSRYRLNGMVEIEAGNPSEVTSFAEEIASSSSYNPATMYCMDIAECKDGLKLVEIGGWQCAGLYDCDIPKIVDVANELAVKAYNDLNE
jgi:hypothetical protein